MPSAKITELLLAGIAFVVIGFALAIGQTMLATNAQTSCTQTGGIWGDFQRSNGTVGNGTNTFPLDNSWRGCCAVVNGTNASLCNWWQTNNYAMNSTYYAQSANNTLAYWLPTLALALIAGIIIAVLLFYLLGSVTGRHGVSSRM